MKEKLEFNPGIPLLLESMRKRMKFQIDVDTSDENLIMFSGIAINYDKEIERGYANVIIRRGAFSEAISNPQAVRILLQHDTDKIIGRTTKLEERDSGLYIEFVVSNQSQDGNETINLIRQGVLKDLSIGFTPTEWTVNEPVKDGDDRIIEITAASLYEVSVVSFPADSDANVDKEVEKENYERFLKGASEKEKEDRRNKYNVQLQLAKARNLNF